MSIRNSPQLTPQLLDAARSNARRSHGPCTAAGKQNSKMNGVKHGERSAPENHYEVMRALGEDPAQFDALKRELSESFGPGDAFFDKQLDDLARLYWRRDRLERCQEGVMRRSLLELEEAQHRRRKEIEGAGFKVGQAINITMSVPAERGARLRLLLSFLGVVREQVRNLGFHAWQSSTLAQLYEPQAGWRPARLCYLLSVYAGSGMGRGEADLSKESPSREMAPAEEPRYKELLRLLEEEMAAVAEEFDYEDKLNEEKAAIERDACLAPSGEEWKLMLRREEALDRAIDRKIKLLLTLRKDARGAKAAELRSAPSVQAQKPADVGAPLVGAQGEPIDEEPSPEGRGCQAPALSSAGA